MESSLQDEYLAFLAARRKREVEPYRKIGILFEEVSADAGRLRDENRLLREQVQSLRAEAATTSAALSAAAPAVVTKLQARLLELQEQLTTHYRVESESAKTRLALSETNQRLREEHQGLLENTARLQHALRVQGDELERVRAALHERDAQVSTAAEELLRMRSLLEAKAREAEAVRAESAGIVARAVGEKGRAQEEVNAALAAAEVLRRERDRAQEALGASQARVMELTKALATASSRLDAAEAGAAAAAAAARHAGDGGGEAVAGGSLAAFVGGGGGAPAAAPAAAAAAASGGAGGGPGTSGGISSSHAGGSSVAGGGGGASPATTSSSSSSGMLGWLGSRVSTIVQAAASAAAGSSPGTGDAAAAAGGRGGGPAVTPHRPLSTQLASLASGAGAAAPAAATAAGSSMSASIADIMSDFVFAGMPVPASASQTIHHAHTSGINAVRFTENSRLVLTGSNDGNIGLWDPATGVRHGILYTSTEGNSVVCVDASGPVVVAGCTDRSVRVWDLNTQRIVRSLTGHTGKVHSVIYVPPGSGTSSSVLGTTAAGGSAGSMSSSGSASGSGSGLFSRGLVITGGADRFIKLWDLRDGRCVRSMDARSIVNGISLASDGMTIACANQDSGVRLFDIRSGGKVAENVTAHTAAVTSVSFTRTDSSARLLTASRDNTLRLLDGRTLEPLRSFLPPSAAVGSSGGIGGLIEKFSTVGAADAGGSGSGLPGAGSMSAGTIVMRHSRFRLPLNTARAVLSPNGCFAAAGSANGFLYSWMTDTGEFDTEIGNPRPPSRTISSGPSGLRRSSTASSSGGADAAAAAGSVSLADVYRSREDSDPHTGISSAAMELLAKGPHDGQAVLGLDWSPDGRFIASGDESGRLVVWSSDG